MFTTASTKLLLSRPCHAAAMSAAVRRLSSTPGASLKLYGFPMSQPVRSVLLLCHSADIKYEFVLVNALRGEHLKPDFKKKHPAGLLPAIEEEGLGVLGESTAILQYLAETRGLEKWYPKDPVARAKINFWMGWHAANTRTCTSGLIRNKMFPPKDGKGPELIAAATKNLSKSLAFMNDRLAMSKYLASDAHPTLADILLLPELDQHGPEAFNMLDFTKHPHVQRWMKDLAAGLPTYSAVFEPVVKTYAAIPK